MRDGRLSAQILGIASPWRVDRVERTLDREEVHIYLEHAADLCWQCPRCGHECVLHDHQPERLWRPLDACQHRTILHTTPPRSDFPEHGAVAVKLPWAEPSRRFAALFEWLAID